MKTGYVIDDVLKFLQTLERQVSEEIAGVDSDVSVKVGEWKAEIGALQEEDDNRASTCEGYSKQYEEEYEQYEQLNTYIKWL